MAGWRNQPLVRERDEHRTRRLWRTLLAISVAIAPAGAYLLQQHECLELSYALSEVRQEQTQLEELERRLRLEKAGLESLPGIERWAVEQRGLVRLKTGKVVVVRRAVTAQDDLIARNH